MKIFISREQSESETLCEILRSGGHEVNAQSQIKREFIAFNPNEVDSNSWVFFSSPYAAQSYFKQGGKPGKIAAIGPGTAAEIRKYAEVSFCGEDGSTEKVAQKFKAIVKNDHVFFLSPEKGLRSVQQFFSPNQITEIVCYRTIPKPELVENCDVYLFSSPSNVKSFFSLNQIPKGSKIISFGNSTSKALLSFEMQDVIESQGTTDFELLKAINSAIQS